MAAMFVLFVDEDHSKFPTLYWLPKLHKLVYVKWDSRVNLLTIVGNLYQIKLWGICNNLNQLTHLRSASGPNADVIKITAKVLFMH